MNILWVEDNPENKKDFWFGNRNVKTVTDFNEAKEIIQTKLNDYDVIVLDINLEKSNKEKVESLAQEFDLSASDFLKKSGMNLCLNLLENGFPREQVIFLTGNADNPNKLAKLIEKLESSKIEDEIKAATKDIFSILSDLQREELKSKNDKNSRLSYLKSLVPKKISENTYDIFCQAYKDACILPPDAISKGIESEAKEELTDWLKKHESNDYLILRRGIIECCNFLKNHIKDDNNIQLRSFVKGASKNKPTIEILKTDIENYLDTIAQFLPVRKPESLNEEYRLFLRTLVHEWEENISPEEIVYGIINKVKKDKKIDDEEIIKSTNEYKTEYEKIHDIHTFAWLSKQTRNWVSHANLLEPLNSEIIAFLFLANMRAMFKLPVEVQSYEYILLKCISKEPADFIDNDEIDRRIKCFEIKVNGILEYIPKEELKDKCGSKSVNGKKTYVNKSYFSQKINDIHQHNTGKTAKHDYQAFLFQLFWANQQQYLENLTANSDDFLPTLARHIYNRKNLEG